MGKLVSPHPHQNKHRCFLSTLVVVKAIVSVISAGHILINYKIIFFPDLFNIYNF